MQCHSADSSESTWRWCSSYRTFSHGLGLTVRRQQSKSGQAHHRLFTAVNKCKFRDYKLINLSSPRIQSQTLQDRTATSSQNQVSSSRPVSLWTPEDRTTNGLKATNYCTNSPYLTIFTTSKPFVSISGLCPIEGSA
jgi:hypothetical protein